MDVKPGYKLTEVGVIPEEWQTRRLGQIGRVVRGGSPRPAGDPRFFNGSYVPWLTVASLTNVPDYALRVSETVSYLTEEGAKRSRTLHPDTLIIANSGATLGVAKILDVTCCANDGVAAVVEQREGDKSFVAYYINSQTANLRQVVATGNGQPNLNTGLIKDIAIPLPPLLEQEAIAEALGTLDGLLDGLDRLLAKKCDLKQAAMQQLLTGQTRLPGFHGEWEVKRLGDILTMRHGKSQRHVEVRDSSIPILATGGRIGFASRPLYGKPSVLLGRKGTINRPQFMDVPFWTVDTLFYSELHNDNSALFLYYLFNTIDWLQYNEGSGVPSLNARTIEAVEKPIPSPNEQAAIAAVLADMDAELSALDARRDKTRALKEAMMQEVLTGRTRLV